jgi:hypothetical protein
MKPLIYQVQEAFVICEYEKRLVLEIRAPFVNSHQDSEALFFVRREGLVVRAEFLTHVLTRV